MTKVVHLEAGQAPNWSDCSMLIERDQSGLFYGTGFGRNPAGEAIIYASLPENDVSLEAALAAGISWAEAHQVHTIYVQQHGE
ncbi:MAG: hypothetical protein M3Q15_00960 [Pseudomonadota bacterium]|nr:hypothetical protein [Pseudomonadota bacterium]